MAGNEEDFREEVLSWVEETEGKLLDNLGRKLADSEPIGFLGVDFEDGTSSVAEGRRWVEANVSEFCDTFGETREYDEIELAVYLASMLSSSFPNAPIGPLALIVARRIIDRRPATHGKIKIEGVTRERSDPVSEDNKFVKTGALTRTFEGSLDRAFFAKTLRTVMKDKKLSQRSAAEAGKTTRSIIQNILAEEASIEMAYEVLSNLGVTLTIHGSSPKPK